MSTMVFGVEIELQDRANPVSSDATIGLYNITTTTSGVTAAGATAINVADGSVFEQGDLFYVGSQDFAIQTVDGNTLNIFGTVTTEIANASTINGNSRLRWLHTDISGVSNWKTDILLPDGIKAWTREIDLSIGGNVAMPGNSEIIIENISRLHNTFDSAEIFFNGLLAKIVRFDDTTKYYCWYGMCEQPTWDSVEMHIPLIGCAPKRNVNIATLITNGNRPYAPESTTGKIIPVSFGKFLSKYDANTELPDYYSYAKLIRTNQIETKYVQNNDIILDTSSDLRFTMPTQYVGLSTFPIIADDNDTPPIGYTIKICPNDVTPVWTVGGIPITTGSYNLDYFVGKYIKVVKADGDSSGSLGMYRKISSGIAVVNSDVRSISLVLEKYLPYNLDGNSTASSSNQCWIEIYDITGEYEADTWPCTSFLDDNGNDENNTIVYFDYDNVRVGRDVTDGEDIDIAELVRAYKRLPSLCCKDDGSGNYNKLEVDPDFFIKDVDSVSSFIVVPPSLVEAIDQNNLNYWTGATVGNGLSISAFTIKNGPGVYATEGYQFYTTRGEISRATDRDYNTSYTIYSVFLGDVPDRVLLAISIKPPSLPKRFSFDRVYLGIRTSNTSGFLSYGVDIFWRKWIGTVTRVIGMTSTGGDVLDDLPDLYYSTNRPSTKDENFFYIRNDDGGGVTVGSDKYVTGYTTFELTDIDNDTYSLLHEVGYFQQLIPGSYGDHRLSLHEVAFIFERNGSIKDEIFVPLNGRIWNESIKSTNGSERHNSATIIREPVEILENVCRLQCFSDMSPIPTNDWGKGYANAARINIGVSPYVAATSGQNTVTVLDGDAFRVGQMIHIGGTAGRERNVISSISGNVLTCENNWTNSYSSTSTDWFRPSGAALWAEGSFDAYDLRNWSVQRHLSRQVLDEDSGYTQDLKGTLCRDLMIMSWIDKHGQECVKRISKADPIAVIDNLTMGDLMDRKKIQITEPTADEIFPEMFVKYQINYGSEETQKMIRVKNIDAESFDSSYVEGWSGSDAEELWDRAHDLWGLSRERTKPPSAITDLVWVNGKFGDALAIESIRNKLDWMCSPRIEFTIHYNRVKNWEEGHEFTIQLLHQTYNTQYNCIVEKIEFDPNPPYECTIRAIMLRATSQPDEYWIEFILGWWLGDDSWEFDLGWQGDTTDIVFEI